MSSTDLRKWIEAVREAGEFVEIPGVDPHLEMGTLTEITQHEPRCPAILFTDIPGAGSGSRLLVNTMGTINRIKLTVGIQGPDSALGFVRAWKDWIKERIPVPPRQVKDGPILEHVQRDGQVNLSPFPAPLWHDQDGGRYLGTAAVTITRDPREGWINLGVYRIMLHGHNEISCYISPGKHGRIHRDEILESGPWRVAISFGHHPVFFLVGSLELPPKLSEYDLVGGMLGEPVEVISGETSGLPIPAWSEMAIEGICTGKDRRPEGPFGEFTGYYASGTRPEYIIQVDRVYHRTNPILLGSPPLRPPSEDNFCRALVRSAILWDELEKVGVPDIHGVWRLPAAAARMITVISLKQRYPGHARQVGHLAAQVRSGAYMGRYVIVVDEDIDPTDTDQVLWALSTRSDPESSIDIQRRSWSGPLDPIIPKANKGFSSRAVIDACRPFEWKEDFPSVVGASPEDTARVRAKYARLLGLRTDGQRSEE